MKPTQTPPTASPTLQQRLELNAWVELRDQLAELDARLEFLKLLLRMGRRPG